MDKKLVKAINDQLNFEIYSSYLYFAMSSHLKSMNLNGFANWMDVQAKEEMTHVMKFYNYLHDRGEDVELEAVDKPPKSWKSVQEIFEQAYKHEQLVSSKINKLADMSLAVKDHATNVFLQWFINEQIEEEANALNVVQQVKMFKDSPNGLFMIDRELAQRVFVDPTAANNKA
jgi:ferritin